MADEGKADEAPKLAGRFEDLAREIRYAWAEHQMFPDSPLLAIGRFEALDFLGSGSYGGVFKVRDPELDRAVALKLCDTVKPEAEETFAREARLYQRGKSLNVHRFLGAPFGLMICYDQRFPQPWRVLGDKGAAVILHGSCHYGEKFTWKRPVVEGHLRSRAAENGCYVLSVNRGNRWPAWGSVAFAPDGRLIARAPYGREALVVVKVDPARAQNRFRRQRRTDLY